MSSRLHIAKQTIKARKCVIFVLPIRPEAQHEVLSVPRVVLGAAEVAFRHPLTFGLGNLITGLSVKPTTPYEAAKAGSTSFNFDINVPQSQRAV